MGTKIMQKGNTIIIEGKRSLNKAKVSATDLRGGIGLVLAGLSTKGEVIVEKGEYILRGYENLVQKLSCLGADIKIID